jgi:hypothetical protein
LARGPLLLSDQELLEQASPSQLEAARGLARVGTRGQEPTQTDIADQLRSSRIGEAVAMSQITPGGEEVARGLAGVGGPLRETVERAIGGAAPEAGRVLRTGADVVFPAPEIPGGALTTGRIVEEQAGHFVIESPVGGLRRVARDEPSLRAATPDFVQPAAGDRVIGETRAGTQIQGTVIEQPSPNFYRIQKADGTQSVVSAETTARLFPAEAPTARTAGVTPTHVVERPPAVGDQVAGSTPAGRQVQGEIIREESPTSWRIRTAANREQIIGKTSTNRVESVGGSGPVPVGAAEPAAARVAAATTGRAPRTAAEGVQAQSQRVAAIARDITPANASDATLQSFYGELEKLQNAVTRAEGGRPERMLNLSKLEPAEAVDRLGKILGGDRNRVIEAVGQFQELTATGATPAAQARFWAQLKNPPMKFTSLKDWGEWAKAIRYSSMLSGPRTLEVNTISFLVELPWRLARDVLASVARGRPGELGPEVRGLIGGWGKANRAFLDAFTTGLTPEAAARGEIPRLLSTRLQGANPLARGAAEVIDLTSRMMGAADQWAVSMAKSMIDGRFAGVIASREGLSGQAWSKRVAELMDGDLPVAFQKQSAEAAERMVFRGEMGAFGRGLESLVRHVPVLGNLMLPFVRTPYQILSRGIERSPVGLVGTVVDVARGAYGRDIGAALRGEVAGPRGVTPLGERLGDNLLGSAFWGYFYSQALGGNISGSGPDRPEEQQLLRSKGWQPYSVKIGDRWVAYNNWGPVAIPLASAAALAEAQRYRKAGVGEWDPAVWVDGIRRTAQIVTDQTYLQGVAAVFKGLDNPQQFGPTLVNNLVTTFVPLGGALATLGQYQDPYQRRIEGLNPLQAVQTRLPVGAPIIGGREQVPIAQDVLGRPMPNVREGVVGALSPAQVSPTRADPVLEELDRLGVTVSAADPIITRSGAEFKLRPEDQRALNVAAGDQITQALNKEMATAAYQRYSPADKRARLEAIIKRVHTVTRDNWIRGLPREELNRRVRESEALQQEIVPVSGR